MVVHLIEDRKQSLILCEVIVICSCGKIYNKQEHWKYTDQEENVTCRTCLRILKRRNNESQNNSIGRNPITD